MRLEIKEFRIPIMLSFLMLCVITYWARQTWSWLDDHETGREEREANKISDILLRALSVVDQNGQLNRKEFEEQFESILQASPYRFLVLIKDGRRMLQLGPVPGGLPDAFEKKAFFLDGTFIFSRRFVLNKNTVHENSITWWFKNKSNGSGLIGGEYLMVLGKDSRQGHIPTAKFVEHIIVPFVAVLLILSANSAAWIMVIRNRRLFEQLEIERARSSHLEDLGLAAAGLAHETKNPLGIISGIAQQVARDPKVPGKSRAMLETIVDEIDKSVSRLGLFMTYAKHRNVNAVPVDARPLIHEIAGVFEPELSGAGISLHVECPEITILADKDMFRQILVNLVLNSLTASARGGSVTIRLKNHGSHASLEVEDMGCGISSDLLPRVFKPYVSGNPDGHGLGLSIVKRFAEDQGWSVMAKSEPDKETVIGISGIIISKTSGDHA